MVTEVKWDEKNFLYLNREFTKVEDENPENLRRKIEPWLSAVFQSEHLSLLIGTGLPIATTLIANSKPPAMNKIEFKNFQKEISGWSQDQATMMQRGESNFEDDLRASLELLQGLKILQKGKEAEKLEIEIDEILGNFVKNILNVEHDFMQKPENERDKALMYLKSFLISFASRTATRDRLNIFTTNYDRFIEYGCDLAGIIILDRFIGKINPVFRSTKIELDCHYNPPGIRGEPRYVEGVARLTKIHGSIDWRFSDRKIIKEPIAFGVENYPVTALKDKVVIYPNSAKGVDTTYYPYSELFRDFSSAVCRPNSTIVIYGYGFGDSHINRILEDMLTIPSTHIVIISFDNASGRIKKFFENSNPAQFTLLIGDHLGNLVTLVDNYLPKAAIDRITERQQKIMERRGTVTPAHEIKDAEKKQ